MNVFSSVSLFWLAAAACVVVALAFVLPALLRAGSGAGKAGRREVNIAVYRDQLKELEAERSQGLLSADEFETARRELETRLAGDALDGADGPETQGFRSRVPAYVVGALLPAAAFGLYFWLGSPAALVAERGAGPGHPAMGAASGEHDFEKLLQRAEDKTRARPDDGEAWAMLAKTYAVMERWPDAARAYEKAVALLPPTASLLSGYAEALAVSQGRVLAGRPIELVRQALAIDPADLKGLELSGLHAYQAGNFVEAGDLFRRLHSQLPPESDYAQDILAALQEIDALVSQHTPGAATAGPPAADTAAPKLAQGATIQGSVEIAPSLKAKLSGKDIVFVFARAGEGGPPLAALRAPAGAFPLEFTLDDSMAMTPGNTLSAHPRVRLVARVSRSGSPAAQPGDIEGELADVPVGSKGVKLVIDRLLP